MHPELEDLLPPDRILRDEASRALYAGDKWTRGPLPELVARPRCTEEVAALLRWANQKRVPVTTRGAGWGYVGGAVTNRGGVLLSLDAMNSIREVSGADFVAVVEAGVVTAQLQNAAQALGLFYPPDPASRAHSTLGGNIATNAGGPRCLKYGVTRPYVLGLEVVTASGEVLQLGGRNHKNKTGFDLLGLFVGSEGMLGVVTGATLKLLPHPPARLGLAATFEDLAGAARGVGAILEAGILPAALEIADEATLAHFQRAHGLAPQKGAHLLVEVDGQSDSVRGEIESIAAIAREAGARQVDIAASEEQVEALWETRRQFSTTLTSGGGAKLNEDVVVPRGRLVELVGFSRALGEKYGIEVACFGHAGDGNIHVNLLLGGEDDSPESGHARAQNALDELFAQVLAWGGAITGEHGIGLAKTKWWPDAVSPQVRALHGQLKDIFDPNGILNPGKWI